MAGGRAGKMWGDRTRKNRKITKKNSSNIFERLLEG